MKKGIDIGGTFIKVLWEDGKKEKHYIKDLKKDREALMEKIREVIKAGNPSGVGIAVAGFTSLNGIVYKSPNIPALDKTDFRKVLEDINIPFVVGNDVNLGAFGEWYYDYRDSKILLLVAVGTGLGTGLVYKGEVFFGVCGSALEMGHHTVKKGGELCNCGRKGCWEAYCSSYAIEREYKKLTGRTLKDYEIAEKAKEGEEEALKVVESFKDYLITGLMNGVHIFNPDRIVLAGGVIETFKEFLRDVPEKVKEISEELPALCLKISFSRAGEFMGARGALAYALKYL
ncbi:ROK family protein [Aquifex aeolicus]|uniref:Transcriptional regulator (NagC/XylR family) n=1 Tax=Aquifex aeolicus (strain VF5) TaxID=224324 RepID=O67468_AQUAE|nr:ROK family protein [Aquifex aeolicus]AAC07429.1 transcriptional regulator (NagC/XylR family) [Aquifex aeolicus VF5]